MNYKHARAAFSALVLAGTMFAPTSQLLAAEEFRLAKFTEPFDDPGQQTAREYAKTDGLTISEATRRLRLMNEAGRLVYQLENRFPDSFSGAEVISGKDFRIAIYGVQNAIGSISQASRELSGSTELTQVLELRTASASASQTSLAAQKHLASLRAQGIDATIASDARTGQFKFLVKDPAAALMGLLKGSLRASTGTRIEQFDGIVTTATEVPGGRNYDGPTQGCTRGFNVKQVSGSLYGISTAGHCDNSGTDGTTGVSLAFKQEWTTNGVDSQWSTFSGRQSYLLVPKFWNGSSVVTVTGATSDYAGLYACKFGRTTLQTCGTVDPYQYTDSPYGDFPRINWNSTYPKQSLEGDSGGPVYVGSLAMGQVHGRDGGYNPVRSNMYYTPLRTWAAQNIPIGVTCSC